MSRGVRATPAEREMTMEELEERAARAKARRGTGPQALAPIDQIRPMDVNGVPDKSAGAYYLRPDGATIMDTLIYYPNGAQLSRRDDPRGRYSQNHDYYQSRQRQKGFEYIGPVLTKEGMRRLVAILERNRPAEVERLEDEIAECQWTVQNTDRPEVRDQQRRRRDQLKARLERVRTPFDPDALVAELAEIARAQRMAHISPEILEVMQEMLDERSAQFEGLVARFTRAAAQGEPDPAMEEGVASID